MTVKLERRHLFSEGQASVTWMVRMPPGSTYSDIFRAPFWAAVAEELSVRSLIRAQAHDLSWDALFVVTGKAAGGLRLAEFPVRPTASEHKDHSAT
jgi:hypothetical protein